MTYLIFGDTFTFPEGTAATNRVFNYAKGFIKNGVKVNVVCFKNEYKQIPEGKIDEITFYNSFRLIKKKRCLLIRRWAQFIKYYKTFQIFREINKRNKLSFIHCYSSLFGTHFFAFLLAKYFHAKLIIEKGEHPLRNYKNTGLKRFQGNLRLAIEPKICDSLFCISKFLIDFYSERGVKPDKLFLMPSTVDIERFNHQYKNPFTFRYILYCGSLSSLKDGVDILINSFNDIAEKFPEINLVLIGGADTLKEEQSFKNLVKELKITDRVFFLGQIPRNEVPAFMCNATILALARPKSMIADAGFPSKLTEYLATGNPVLVTKVGDIPIYLQDNENAFIADPGNTYSFANKLEQILCNYDFAQIVGQNGKKLTSSVFNNEYQAERIINHLTSAKRSKTS